MTGAVVENPVETGQQNFDKPRDNSFGVPVGTLVRQSHGGAIRNGGTNRGGPGRPPKAFKRFYRELLNAQRTRETKVGALTDSVRRRLRKRCGICLQTIGSLKHAVIWPKAEGSDEMVIAHPACRDFVVLRDAYAAVQSLSAATPGRKPISTRLRTLILERDRFRCRRCGWGAPDVRLAVDHIVPVADGGVTEEGNLQTLCEDCNAGKSDRPPTAHDLAGALA